MTPKMQIRRHLKTLSFFLLFCLLIAFGILLRDGLRTAETLENRLLRLHVLAVSDEEEDQARKLLVRDCILEQTKTLLSQCSSSAEAEQRLTEEIPALEAAAEAVMAEAGDPQEVHISIGEEYYPTRVYETVTLPCGVYRSMRVEIGAAEGQNWWCVLYPPLCLSAASVDEPTDEDTAAANEEALLEAGLSKDETCLITGNTDGSFKLRFRFLELLGQLKETLFA